MELPVSPLELLALGLEYLRPLLAALVTVISIDVVLLVIALLGVGGGFRNASQAIKSSLLLGSVVGLVTLVLAVPATGARFTDLLGWLDYVTLVSTGIGFGLAAAVISYPAIQLLVASTSYQTARHFLRR